MILQVLLAGNDLEITSRGNLGVYRAMEIDGRWAVHWERGNTEYEEFFDSPNEAVDRFLEVRFELRGERK